jgi:hypothetical protein
VDIEEVEIDVSASQTYQGHSVRRRMPWVRAWAIGLVAALGAGTLAISLTRAASASTGSLAGNAGTNTALPVTDSAVTASGRGAYSGLTITVNQTKNLINQAVSVTWTGGRLPLTVSGGSQVTGNFLQIMQCWGDNGDAANPGPPPEGCEFGGFEANAAKRNSLEGGAWIQSRVMSQSQWSTYTTDAAQGFVDAQQGLLWRPFHAVDGTVINRGANFAANDLNTQGQGGFWQNPYFNYYSTNEDVVAVSHGTTPDQGTGSELFTLDTGLEAPGIGCGQKVQPLPDGSKVMPRCWLVVVPRGTPAEENPPTINPALVDTSPLTPQSWQNRIAIPLDFSPVDSPCAIGADERRIVGSELATPAVTNWQPTLCSAPGAPPYNYASISDDQARQQLVSTLAPPGMAVVSQPLNPAIVDPNNPVVYAPLTLSGVTIAFNVERTAALQNGVPKDPGEPALQGIRVAHINLTPRLVAKLLTESYQNQFYGLLPTPPKGYEWYLTNPTDLVADPDFVQYNPEFAVLTSGQAADAYLVVEQPTADAAYQLWRWVVADPEAAAWLAGAPDQWGTKVNPVYSTDPHVNPSGQPYGNPIPNTYPKSDPYCYVDTNPLDKTQDGREPRPLCLLDLEPFANSMQIAGLDTRNGFDGRKRTVPDPAQPTADAAWLAAAPQPAGHRAMLSVTDSASAARYGLQTASLSRAGDDGATRTFVAPDQPGLVAGAKSMVPSAVPDVLQSDPKTAATGAYPLAMLTYAAATPNSLNPASRNDYANFVTYAVGPGQVQGLKFGQLPPGYAPLPQNLVDQADAAAKLMRNGVPVPAPPSPSDTGATNGGPNGPLNPSSTSPGANQPSLTEGPGPTGPGAMTGGGLGNGGITGANSPTLAKKSALSHLKLKPEAATGRTPGDILGAIRYALPVALAVGIAAALGARLVGRRRDEAATLDPSPSVATGSPEPT